MSDCNDYESECQRLLLLPDYLEYSEPSKEYYEIKFKKLLFLVDSLQDDKQSDIRNNKQSDIEELIKELLFECKHWSKFKDNYKTLLTNEKFKSLLKKDFKKNGWCSLLYEFEDVLGPTDDWGFIETIFHWAFYDDFVLKMSDKFIIKYIVKFLTNYTRQDFEDGDSVYSYSQLQLFIIYTPKLFFQCFSSVDYNISRYCIGSVLGFYSTKKLEQVYDSEKALNVAIDYEYINKFNILFKVENSKCSYCIDKITRWNPRKVPSNCKNCVQAKVEWNQLINKYIKIIDENVAQKKLIVDEFLPKVLNNIVFQYLE